MNFGDDPLADVLSDGSDSFFDDPKPRKASLTKTPEKKSITDLFNIADSKQDKKPIETSKKSTDDWLGLDSIISKEQTQDPKQSPARGRRVPKKISFDDDDDILGNMGLTKRPPSRGENVEDKNKPASTQLDLFESILGTPSKPEGKKSTGLDDILKEHIAKTPPRTPQISEAPREGRRVRRPSSTGLMDPLGLFSNEVTPASKSKEPEQTDPTKIAGKQNFTPPQNPVLSKSTPNISTADQSLPDWLGGATIKQSKSENVLTQKAPELEDNSNIEVSVPVTVTTEESTTTLNSILKQQKLSQSHMEYQNTSIALQQQESQLLMALQLKKYEENLMGMQQKQQNILQQQEQQFNSLLEQQFAKQQIMENNMRLQQERINNHIQLLISQPHVTQHTSVAQVEELKKSTEEETVKLYENLIMNLKDRQHDEIILLEDSYKKQINLLEQTLESVESRLKAELEKLTDIFEDKFKTINKQRDEDINKYKQKIQELEANHSDDIKQIRENHQRVVDEIKYEHSTVLDNIKDVKKSESTLFSESNLYLQKLDTNIEILFNSSKSIQDLKEDVAKDYGILTKAREETLRAKEREISLMRETLEKCRQSAEQERAELLGLVRSLETKIAEQNQNGREERWAFQQAASTLAARSAALDREADFNRASLEREREQLKTLRESIMAEQEKLMLQITEEKLSLSAQKSRIETSNKLSLNYDSQKTKAEIDAAIQVAKEAAEMTDRERENLHREKCEIERLKRTLLDNERKLNAREKELENLIRDAERRVGEGEKAIHESKSRENQYNERLKDLQNQLIVLSNREKKLAEEKIALAKERLTLNTLARQMRKCGLCNSDAQRLQDNDLSANFNNIIYSSSFENVDSDVIRLRLGALEDNVNVDEENLPN